MNAKLFKSNDALNRCVVILAGGDGVRLRSFVQRLRGDCLPKQYVKLLNGRSMLEATLQRADKLVPSERQFVVVTESHFDYVEVQQQLSNFPGIQVDPQPCNRGTGMGLLLSLARLRQCDPESVVVVFPSDHFIREEDLFLAHVDAACRLVEQDNSKIILLGVVPTGPETDYGYILPSNQWPTGFPYGARLAARFIEKPDFTLARSLIRQGGFWNTMVMVFNLKTLLEHIRTMNPSNYVAFDRICRAIGWPNLANVVKQEFAQAGPMNLAKGFLEKLVLGHDRALLVLPVRGVHWSDWGSEDRIMETLEHTKCCGVTVHSSGGLIYSLQIPKLTGSA